MDSTSKKQGTICNTDEFLPRRAIRRGAFVRPLPRHSHSLADLTIETNKGRLSIDGYMTRHRTGGLIILKDGKIALERYSERGGPEVPWPSFSVAKSITSTLCGAALYDGAIGSLDDRCDHYLPRLLGSGYEGVTVRNVLRMCSGVAWSEEAEARADGGGLQLALSSRRPVGLLDLVCGLARTQAQGTVFNYSTAESALLGAVVVGATGRSLANYCTDSIWGPAGMEADGQWLLDSDDGLEWGGFGISARLRDWAARRLPHTRSGTMQAGNRRLMLRIEMRQYILEVEFVDEVATNRASRVVLGRDLVRLDQVAPRYEPNPPAAFR